jgi:hypothetical protein
MKDNFMINIKNIRYFNHHMTTVLLTMMAILIDCNFLEAATPYGGMTDGQVPHFLIPRISNPPVIDGVINSEEWKESVALSGVAEQGTNMLNPRPSTFFLAWDNDNLYLACRVWIPSDFKPKAVGRAQHQANTNDSGLELILTPKGKNIPTGRPEIGYKFNVNCLGFDGTLQKVALGQMMQNWMPEFKTSVSLGQPGSAAKDGRWWQIEMVLPVKEFELNGPNNVGDNWRFSLGMNGMSSIFSQDRIPCNSGYFIPNGHCIGTLSEKIPCSQVLMEEFPGPCDGTAQALFQVYNPLDKAVSVEISVYYRALRKNDQREIPEELFNWKKMLTVEPGQLGKYQFAEKFAGELGKDRGSIEYRVSQKDQELFRYFVFFKSDYPEELMKPKPSAAAFPLEGLFDPVGSTLKIVCDSYYLDHPETAKLFNYQLTSNTDGKVLAKGTLDKPVNYYFSKLLHLPELQPGIYTLQAIMDKKDGSKGGTERQTIEKKNERESFSAWWDNDTGNTERVISPYIPMKLDKSSVSTWGRCYDLNGLGLPRKILSGEGEVMSSEARIVVTVNGKEMTVSVPPQPEFTETCDWRVSFKGRAKGGGLEFESKGWVEQDGLCYLELSYEPGGKPTTVVDGLRIEFPLRPENSKSLYCIGSGNNFAARTSKLLDEKEGALWSTLETGRAGSNMRVGSFYPSVWIGDNHLGLSWWADNDQGWFPDNGVPAHSVYRKGNEVVLANNIIGKKETVEGKHTIIFSYMATPYRPLPKGWRAGIISEDGTFLGPHKKRTDPKTGKIVDAWYCLHPPSYNTAEWTALWGEYKQKADGIVQRKLPFNPRQARSGEYVHTSIPIVGYYNSLDSDVFKYFNASWSGGRYLNFSKSHSDYLLYLINRSITEGGIRKFYWDLFSPSYAVSEQAGLGYRLPDGQIQPGYFGFNLRRFSMRLYALCNDKGLSPGGVVVHCTNAFFLVACPWVDALLDGEEHTITDNSPFDWVDGYPVDRMRTLSNPHNFGNVISWMHTILATGQRRFDLENSQVEYIRLFDCWSRTFTKEIVPISILEWGINDEKIKYLPFWENTYVKTDDKDILVSMWQLPDRVMLDVFNYNGKEKKDAVMHVGLEELNLDPKLKWQEFISVTSLDKGPRYYRNYWDPMILEKEKFDLKDEEWKSEPLLDFEKKTLTIKGILPHRGRIISIRKY